MNRLTAANDITFGYDPAGRVISTKDSNDIAFGAVYDNAGRLTAASYNDAEMTVTYTYDARDLLTRVTDNLSGAQMDFTYDADSRLIAVTRANGVNGIYTWDAASRLIRIQEGTILDIQSTYNGAGEMTQTVMTAPLDPADALTTGSSDFSVDDASQINSAGYAYDARGRQTADPDRTYGWDNAGRLVQIAQDEHNTLLGYNGLGDLRLRNDGTEQLKFYVNAALGLRPIVAERNAATGQMLRFYVYAPGGRLLYMVDHANANAVYYYHFDHIGSTLALTDAAGAVSDSYAYDPYGRLLDHQGDNPQRFTFIGEWGVRSETDRLYYMRARCYDAATGRFLSPEPIWPQLSDPKTLNPYQYADADPVQLIDPTGLSNQQNEKIRVGFVLSPEVQALIRQVGTEKLFWHIGSREMAEETAIEESDRPLSIGGRYAVSATDSTTLERRAREFQQQGKSDPGVPDTRYTVIIGGDMSTVTAVIRNNATGQKTLVATTTIEALRQGQPAMGNANRNYERNLRWDCFVNDINRGLRDVMELDQAKAQDNALMGIREMWRKAMGILRRQGML